MYRETISKEELSELPLKQFEGEIYLVETKEDYRFAIDYLKNQKTLGFDTETKPAFKRGVINTVALLQLSTNDKAFLFRLYRTGLTNGIKGILENPEIKKIGVAIRDDIRTIQKLMPFHPGGFVELQDHVKHFGIENSGLKKITGIVLGFRISKSQRLTNWEAEELTEAQQNYAATDAWVAYCIYHSLKN